MAFVHIFVDVLHSLDTGADLHIDVAVILGREEGRIRHNPPVVNLFPMAHGLATIVAPTVCGIGVLVHGSALDKWLWEALSAPAIFHASGIGIL